MELCKLSVDLEKALETIKKLVGTYEYEHDPSFKKLEGIHAGLKFAVRKVIDL